MNGYDWPGDGESDLDWPDWSESADFFPSPSLALARGLISRARSGRRIPSVVSRPGGRPPVATAPVPPVLREELTKVYETMKRLEQKQDEQTRQLALLQVRSSGQQTGEVFRQALTTGVLNAINPALNQRDLATGLAQFVPAVQAWQGLGPSISSKPFSTFVFPLGTALALFFLRKPPTPRISATKYTGVAAAPADATVTLEGGVGLRLFWRMGGAPAKGTAGFTEYAGPFSVAVPGQLRVKALTPFGIESDETVAVFT